MQLVIAAITTWPWSSSTVSPLSSWTRDRVAGRRVARPPPRLTRRVAACRPSPSWSSAGGSEAGKDSAIASSSVFPSCSPASGSHSCIASRKAGLASASGDPVLRALRAGDAGLDVAEVELERVGVGRVLGARLVEEALLARVGVDQLDLLGRPPGELEVAQRLGVDREDRAGRAELRRHVPDRRPVGERRGSARPGPKNSTNFGDDAAARAASRSRSAPGRSRSTPSRQLAVELEADHLRQQHRDRLAEHRRLGLDPADAPAEHAEAVDHRRVGVGADQGVGVGLRDRRRSRGSRRTCPGTRG